MFKVAKYLLLVVAIVSGLSFLLLGQNTNDGQSTDQQLSGTITTFFCTNVDENDRRTDRFCYVKLDDRERKFPVGRCISPKNVCAFLAAGKKDIYGNDLYSVDQLPDQLKSHLVTISIKRPVSVTGRIMGFSMADNLSLYILDEKGQQWGGSLGDWDFSMLIDNDLIYHENTLCPIGAAGPDKCGPKELVGMQVRVKIVEDFVYNGDGMQPANIAVSFAKITPINLTKAQERFLADLAKKKDAKLKRN